MALTYLDAQTPNYVKDIEARLKGHEIPYSITWTSGDQPLSMAVGGFYEPKQLVLSVYPDHMRVAASTGAAYESLPVSLYEVQIFEDLVLLNFMQWKRHKDVSSYWWFPDPKWRPAMQDMGLIVYWSNLNSWEAFPWWR